MQFLHRAQFRYHTNWFKSLSISCNFCIQKSITWTAENANGGPKDKHKFCELEARLRYFPGLGLSATPSRARWMQNLSSLPLRSGETIFGRIVERRYGKS